jgi:FHS family L-fucose permease-like MFS transporter
MEQPVTPGLVGGVRPGASNTMPLVIVTMLFFMWGLLTSLNDVLIPHLKAVYMLSYVQAMCVQFCFFGAYFIVSMPAGLLIRRIGYQRGAVAGLMVAAAGCGRKVAASLWATMPCWTKWLRWRGSSAISQHLAAIRTM